MTLAALVEDVLGRDLPVGVTAYDGSRAGPTDASATVALRSPDALRRIITAPGELGFARAYVSGDLEIDGDIFAFLELRKRMPNVRLEPKAMYRLVQELGGRPATERTLASTGSKSTSASGIRSAQPTCSPASSPTSARFERSSRRATCA